MTLNHKLNTPEKGTKDWHVPLNDNFESLDSAIEIRDTEANRSDYEPKSDAKYFATDTQAIYLGDGSNWQRVASSGDRIRAAANRQIVPVAEGLGPSDAIDPSTTETPVTDALRKIENTNPHGKGTVYLPARNIDQGEDLGQVPIRGKRIIGLGGPNQGDGARIHFNKGTSALRTPSGLSSSYSWFEMDNVTLRGTKEAGTPAFRFDQTGRHINLGTIRLRSWRAKAGDSGATGIISAEDGRLPFSSTWNTIQIDNCEGPGIYAARRSGGLMLGIYNFYYAPDSESPAISMDGAGGMQLTFDRINSGGACSKIMNVQNNAKNGFIRANRINFEPKSGDPTNVIDYGGSSGLFIPGQIRYHDDLDEVVRRGFNGGKTVIGDIHAVGDRSIANNPIVIENDNTDHSYYRGPSSDIDNVSGTKLSYPWVTWDGVWKTSTGTGFNRGTDRRVETPVNESYSPSNVSNKRTFDTNSTSQDEIADVLGTLINDLQTGGYIR